MSVKEKLEANLHGHKMELEKLQQREPDKDQFETTLHGQNK
jgi:hypothetical protein